MWGIRWKSSAVWSPALLPQFQYGQISSKQINILFLKIISPFHIFIVRWDKSDRFYLQVFQQVEMLTETIFFQSLISKCDFLSRLMWFLFSEIPLLLCVEFMILIKFCLVLWLFACFMPPTIVKVLKAKILFAFLIHLLYNKLMISNKVPGTIQVTENLDTS